MIGQKTSTWYLKKLYLKTVFSRHWRCPDETSGGKHKHSRPRPNSPENCDNIKLRLFKFKMFCFGLFKLLQGMVDEHYRLADDSN